MGRFYTGKPINHRAAINLMRTASKMGNDLKIVDMEGGVFLFNFKIESQLQWVQDSGLWGFDDHLLVLWRWEKGMVAHPITFTHAPFWIQGELDVVIVVDTKALESDQARFLRIRVELPLNRPLHRGGPVVSPEGERSIVAFRYERLVGWCFVCGHIGHDVKHCGLPAQDPARSEKPYGKWLKAGSRHQFSTDEGRHPSPLKQQTTTANVGTNTPTASVRDPSLTLALTPTHGKNLDSNTK
nr:hypothetical protein CFP56_45635 [Quercus suber]